ncbi:hypothetical protein C8Q80DRAFT_466783 [Daedaleopsis nitida]|nr:hypothetical protein C8Q80DRAFT_466783 [Daedaleopsis nitida]
MTRTHPHKIWFIDEIIRNVLAHLPFNGNSHTLACCAYVSHSLCEPALDLLWFKMSGLFPLFKLLPKSFLEKRDESIHGRIFVPIAPIGDDEWARFKLYARRVRKLQHHYLESPSERLGAHAFAALVHHASLSGTTILPNLQELSWLQFSHLEQCLPFLTLSLRRVTVYVQAGSSPARDDLPAASIHERSASASRELLRVLDVQSPFVEELKFEGVELPETLGSNVAFQHLRALHLGSVSTPPSVILSYCGKMPRLASLALVFRGSLSGPRPWTRGAHVAASLADTRLPAIECLQVAGVPSDIEDILDAVDSVAFHTVALSISVPEFDTDGWTRCASLLSARFARSLRVVRAECKRAGTLVPTQPRSFDAYVRPLLPLRDLSKCTLMLEDPAGIAMADADVESMAMSWPSLASLDVALRGGSSVTPLPSISSLEAFARHCAFLTTLRLPLSQDISCIDSWSTRASNSHCACSANSLRHLWIAGLRFNRMESEHVVEFLRRLFPLADLGPMVGAGMLRLD